jgi:hypothetical protein
MSKDNKIKLPLASISDKKVEGDFEGGTVTSNGGVMFLRKVETRVGVIQGLAKSLRDRRHQSYIKHSYEDLLRQRIFQIACGYEDANDCNELRKDPAMKAACGRLPISGDDLASQPTMTRLENSVCRRDLYRMAVALVDTFLGSYEKPPDAIIMDIDDTEDTTDGGQQMSLFNGYYDEDCFLPLHIYEGQSGKLITTILRPGLRISGKEIVTIFRRLVPYIRKRWPKVEVFLRGDSHFSAPEVHDWCEKEHVYYVLGQTGNAILKDQIATLLKQAHSLYQYSQKKVRLFRSFSYQAQSWKKPRRIVAKVEVSSKGENIRFVVTSIQSCQPSFIYDTIYCARGRMEGFIKNHKSFLLSDRTSCHCFEANQFRLFLHSAAYVLLHYLAQKGLKDTQWVKAQFNTIQNRILKVGAKVRELKTKIKFHLPTSFPLKEVFVKILINLDAAFP